MGVSRGGRNTKIHLVAASDRIAITFKLSAGQCHDATQGLLLFEDKRLDELAKRKTIYMSMDKGYEDDITRKAVKKRDFIPVVPPKSNRKKPWRYNKTIYKRRNEVERLFRRIKGFRRVCTRYEKLDIIYMAFLNLALIYDELRLC
ncbi:MAG: IS5 family transposase [Cytophagaceae bacterium]|nr:IS5 family transposase [Cytophagaceae bacterium]